MDDIKEEQEEIAEKNKLLKRKLRKQTLGEEIGNSITHGLGFAAAIVGTIFLLIKADTGKEYLASWIYGIGMVMLYLSSCLYHSFRNDTTVKKIFKRFDHLSIYLLIGGTFAPILLCGVDFTKGMIFFIIQWILIFFGVILKAINTQKYHLFHVVLYLAIGWSGLLFVPDMLNNSLGLFWFILGGGLAYSLGIAFYASKFPYAHFVWHFFCLTGTILQFLGIYFFILN